MTDGISSPNGHTSDAESARRVEPHAYGTPGYGHPAGEQAPPAPDSGEAGAWPSWPGVARPAGWFLSAPGEAAPPARPGTEPARTDAIAQAPQPESARQPQPALHPQPTGEAQAGGEIPGDDQHSGSWYEDPQPTSVHQIPRLWSWRPGQPRSEPGQEPSPSGAPRPGAWQKPREPESWEPESWEPEPWQARYQGAPPRPAPRVPSVGPTAALRGRAGGPGFVVPQGAVPGLYDPAHRSGWQLAQGVWQDGGISWDPSEAESEPEPEAGWSDYPRDGFSCQDWPDGGRDQVPPPAFAPPPLGAPTFADAPAPTFADAPAQTRADAQALPAPPCAGLSARPAEPVEPDELYRAWQGSVHRASSRSAAARRRQAWQVARVGVPAAVIITVGAGAVMMLTGKTSEMLAARANQGSPVPGSSGTPAVLAGNAFGGYPGQHGTVTVSSIASAGGTRLAVGSADGHPAIWRRAADGTWTLVSASSPTVYQQPGIENLTSVAHGPAGWIAVGDVLSGAGKQPVVLTSADGVTWQPSDSLAAAAGPGSYLNGVTASRNGYVVVGKQVSGGRTFAGMWWSADLRNWVPGNNGGLDGRLKSSTVYAVAATETGFIAAGSHGNCHAVWTSADGRQWNVHDITVPAGASGALLRQVAVSGPRVVAAGYAITKAGDVPVAVVSTDGGLHWRQIVLSAPAGLGRVTALTAAGDGFVAAGHAGPVTAQRAVTWSSPDGLSWSAATPAAAGMQQITALSASGGTVTGTAQRGSDPSVVTVPAP